MLQKKFKSNLFVIFGMILLAMVTLSNGVHKTEPGNSVTKITFNPATPNILLNGQKINISFSYATTQVAGVQIFARPITAASTSPSYSASSAPVSPMGSGTGTQSFTITSGKVKVDQVRFQMFNADQTQLLFEAYVPVNFQFITP